MNHEIRYDWSLEEIETLYHRPLLDLVFDAATISKQRSTRCTEYEKRNTLN